MDRDEVKFLIIRFSSIGDIVLTTPIVRCLKQGVKGAKVHFLTKPQYKSILDSNPYIDKLHLLKSFPETIDELKNEGFDYIIDLHKSLRSLRFKKKLKILDFTFPKLNWEKFLMVHFKINKLPDVHIVDRYFEAVKLFDVYNDQKGLDFFINENDRLEIGNYNLFANSFCVFAIGGQHQTKKLPPDNIKTICDSIRGSVVLIGGKEDFEDGEYIADGSSNVLNLCGSLSVCQSASLLKQSRLVISHDTGMMHIAAAFKKDIFSIWGNTIPEFGMYPYLAGENSLMFQVDNLKCRPCSKIGFSSCPKKHFECMNNQDFNLIIEKINSLLA